MADPCVSRTLHLRISLLQGHLLKLQPTRGFALLSRTHQSEVLQVKLLQSDLKETRARGRGTLEDGNWEQR